MSGSRSGATSKPATRVATPTVRMGPGRAPMPPCGRGAKAGDMHTARVPLRSRCSAWVAGEPANRPRVALGPAAGRRRAAMDLHSDAEAPLVPSKLSGKNRPAGAIMDQHGTAHPTWSAVHPTGLHLNEPQRTQGPVETAAALMPPIPQGGALGHTRDPGQGLARDGVSTALIWRVADLRDRLTCSAR